MTFGRLPLWPGLLFGGAGLLVVVIGWWFIVTQDYRLATYLPVTANITQSHVESHTGSKGSTTYEPVISYTYTVEGRLLHGDRVSAVGNYSSSGNWAYLICAQFPTGGRATAWYSAQDPTSAFLSREPQFVPHFLALFGVIFLAVGVWLVFQSVQGRRTPKPPVLDTDGWYRLGEEGTIRGRFWFYTAGALEWYGYFALVIGDYLLLRGFHADLFCLIAGLTGGLMGVAALVQMGRYWRLSHDFLDAAVHTHQATFQCGQSIEFRVRQGVRRSLEIAEIALGAVCMRSDRTKTGTSVTYTGAKEARSVWKSLEINRTYAAGDQLSATGQVTLPQDADPSSPPGDFTYPVFQWAIVLRVVAKGEPELRVYFPIAVGARA